MQIIHFFPQVKHADIHKKYKEEVEQLKNNQLNINFEKEIKVEFKSYAAQILYREHFRIIEQNGDKLRVICNHCKSGLKSGLNNQYSLRSHLRVCVFIYISKFTFFVELTRIVFF